MSRPFSKHYAAESPWGHPPKQKYKDTDIEMLMRSVLSSIGSEHKFWVAQFTLPCMVEYSAHLFDFAVPSAKLVIEVDGCRWHGCKKCYPLLAARPKDYLIDCEVHKLGWEIIRFWEHTMKGQLDLVRRDLLSVLKDRL